MPLQGTWEVGFWCWTIEISKIFCQFLEDIKTKYSETGNVPRTPIQSSQLSEHYSRESSGSQMWACIRISWRTPWNQITRHSSEVSDWGSLRWVLRICISHSFTGNADAPGPRTSTLRTTAQEQYLKCATQCIGTLTVHSQTMRLVLIVSIFTWEDEGLENSIRMPRVPGWEAELGSEPGMWTPEPVFDTVRSLGVRTSGARVKPLARASGLLKQVCTCVFEDVEKWRDRGFFFHSC